MSCSTATSPSSSSCSATSVSFNKKKSAALWWISKKHQFQATYASFHALNKCNGSREMSLTTLRPAFARRVCNIFAKRNDSSITFNGSQDEVADIIERNLVRFLSAQPVSHHHHHQTKNWWTTRLISTAPPSQDKNTKSVDENGQPRLLTTRREALSLYREIVRITALFEWPNDQGRPWYVETLLHFLWFFFEGINTNYRYGMLLLLFL